MYQLGVDQLQTQVVLYQNRGKIFSWSEIFELTGKLPSHIQWSLNDYKAQIPDPLWAYTQSAKNYDQVGDERLFKNYSKPENWKLTATSHGVSSKVNIVGSMPIWVHLQDNNAWYWKQLKLIKLANVLRLLPGVKQVFVIGSVATEIAKFDSDIDLIFECFPGMTMLSRFWVKVVLKVLGLDVHSFFLEISKFLVGVFIGFWPSKAAVLTYKIQEMQWNFKNRVGLKLDAGIFFENFHQVEQRYGQEDRQLLWLYKKLRLNPKLEETLIHQTSLGFLPTSSIKLFSLQMLKFIAFVLGQIAWPLVGLQYLLYHYKNGDNLNFYVDKHFVGFIPRIYKNGYWQRLTKEG